jgi:hypothetical protein
MARAADDLRREDEQGTIGVRVTLFADLRRFLPPGVDGPHRRTVPAGSTVAELLAAIGVPDDADITIGVDGELADRATPLREGADVMLLSPMEGGADAPNPTDTMRASTDIRAPRAPLRAARQPVGGRRGEGRSLPPTSQETP